MKHKKSENIETVIDEVVEEVINETVEEVINETVEEVINETVEEVVEETETLNGQDVLTGKVSCAKLNLREAASKESKVLRVLDKDALVNIYQEENHVDFYHVCTPDGVDGYCMKKFIVIE